MTDFKSPFLKKVIASNDRVILHLGQKQLQQVFVTPNGITQTKYGAVKHDDIIGKEYGSKHKCPKGFVHLLPLTPELWSLSLPHRTQILYTPDISLIVSNLDLLPGSVVCEAGTGSGSLTHALARTVLPTGKVYTFDFHQARVDTATKEFQLHGLSSIVECAQRDIVELGFPFENFADAVMLDLPQPWKVISNIRAVLKQTGGRVCLFSPCIEQVQKSCEALKNENFVDIQTVECLQRKLNVVRASLPPPNIGQLSASHFIECQQKRSEFSSGDPCDEKLYCCKPSSSENTLCQKGVCFRAHLGGISTPLSDNVIGENRWEAVPVDEMPGHTGFLTFASYRQRCTQKQTVNDDDS